MVFMVKTVFPSYCNLSLMDSSDKVNRKLQSNYRASVGKRNYISETRIDLGFAAFAQICCSFSVKLKARDQYVCFVRQLFFSHISDVLYQSV
jgi:hypothetical protein